MINESSIKYLSSLLDNPAIVTDGDYGKLDVFKRSFPYFIPVRYLEALESNKKSGIDSDRSTTLHPYIGNWILFSDFVDAGNRDVENVEEERSTLSNGEDFFQLIRRGASEHMPVADSSPVTEDEPMAMAHEDVPESQWMDDEQQNEILAHQAESEAAVENEIIEEFAANAEPLILHHEDEPVEENEMAGEYAASEEPPVEHVHHEVAQEPVATEEFASAYTSPLEQMYPEAEAENEIGEDFAGVEEHFAQHDHTETLPDHEHHQVMESVPETSEPAVAVSESFLQLIREDDFDNARENIREKAVEGMTIAPVEIVPQPVFDLPVESPVPELLQQDEHTEHDTEAHDTTTPVIEHMVAADEVHAETATVEADQYAEELPLISPIYTQDYFLQQGEKISDELPDEIDALIDSGGFDDADKSLMVMMSFSEWLLHFKNTTRKQEEEKKDQKALKTMWQKEKLAAAIEEENEEIPENVFEMAVNSIAKEDGLASESLADIYIKQGKYDKAIEMFRKLSLRNPQKNAYFARKIEEVLKDKI